MPHPGPLGPNLVRTFSSLSPRLRLPTGVRALHAAAPVVVTIFMRGSGSPRVRAVRRGSDRGTSSSPRSATFPSGRCRRARFFPTSLLSPPADVLLVSARRRRFLSHQRSALAEVRLFGFRRGRFSSPPHWLHIDVLGAGSQRRHFFAAALRVFYLLANVRLVGVQRRI